MAPKFPYLLSIFFLLACSGSQVAPQGQEVMGLFAFDGQMLESKCDFYDSAAQTLQFQAVFSKEVDSEKAYLTYGQLNTEGKFDGQFFESTRKAPRRFELVCGSGAKCGSTELAENLRVALISKSQDDAIRKLTSTSGCPSKLESVLLQIEKAPGVTPPQKTERGFDAVRACGTLANEVVPDEKDSACVNCPSCSMVYRVSGVRR